MPSPKGTSVEPIAARTTPGARPRSAAPSSSRPTLNMNSATPTFAILVVSVISLAARVAFLGSPCHQPCTSASDHVLVFDESYYVNAARVIAGVRPPPGAHYRATPSGDDPNAEHPQLAKVVIAGAIELFGDGPLAWRLPSILLGSLALSRHQFAEGLAFGERAKALNPYKAAAYGVIGNVRSTPTCVIAASARR